GRRHRPGLGGLRADLARRRLGVVDRERDAAEAPAVGVDDDGALAVVHVEELPAAADPEPALARLAERADVDAEPPRERARERRGADGHALDLRVRDPE